MENQWERRGCSMHMSRLWNNIRNGRGRKQQPGFEATKQCTGLCRVQLQARENNGLWSLQQSEISHPFFDWPESCNQDHEPSQNEGHGGERYSFGCMLIMHFTFFLYVSIFKVILAVQWLQYQLLHHLKSIQDLSVAGVKDAMFWLRVFPANFKP